MHKHMVHKPGHSVTIPCVLQQIILQVAIPGFWNGNFTGLLVYLHTKALCAFTESDWRVKHCAWRVTHPTDIWFSAHMCVALKKG